MARQKFAALGLPYYWFEQEPARRKMSGGSRVLEAEGSLLQWQ